MWKAVLILFMTSSTHPISMMTGEFPETFKSEASCWVFLNIQDMETKALESAILTVKTDSFEVLHHEFGCFQDSTGEPV